MLNIKTVKNSLISDESNDGFCGNYSVSIMTKPVLTYFTANIDSEITVV